MLENDRVYRVTVHSFTSFFIILLSHLYGFLLEMDPLSQLPSPELPENPLRGRCRVCYVLAPTSLFLWAAFSPTS